MRISDWSADVCSSDRNARDNVTAGLEFAHVPKPDAVRQGNEWLRRVGLGGFENRYPHQMSGGMRKRAMLAQTLIRNPDIILMDEPFQDLDIQTRQLMENEGQYRRSEERR